MGVRRNGGSGLGRSQAVRHWILIPAFEGSIPSAPANVVAPFYLLFTLSILPRYIKTLGGIIAFF
jgi:hypothetical protein